jgi:predicted anti-sigma-YlaC factor YlaD
VGNFSAGPPDYPGMSTHPGLTCDQARLALSARLDGEPLGVPADRLNAHMATCAGCADWLARAEQLTRLVRVQPARVPDLTATILAAIAADRAAAAKTRAAKTRAAKTRTAADQAAAAQHGRVFAGRQAIQRLLQAAVAAIAAMELLVVMPVMLGVEADEHANHEVGAFAAAVAVAFLLAAFQPKLARAYTPIAVVLAVCLTATSGLDIGEHRVTVLHEIGGHWGTIIQAALIFALGRLHSPSPRSQDRQAQDRHNFPEVVASGIR